MAVRPEAVMNFALFVSALMLVAGVFLFLNPDSLALSLGGGGIAGGIMKKIDDAQNSTSTDG